MEPHSRISPIVKSTQKIPHLSGKALPLMEINSILPTKDILQIKDTPRTKGISQIKDSTLDPIKEAIQIRTKEVILLIKVVSSQDHMALHLLLHPKQMS